MNIDNRESILGILTALTLAAFLLFNAFFFTVFNNEIYNQQFDRYGVYEHFPEKDISEINGDLLHYLSGQELESQDFFNDIEIAHLKDVKNIFLQLKIIYACLLIILLPLLYFSASRRRMLVGSIQKSYIGVGIASLVLFTSSLFFEKIFIKMHELIFSNDNWQLDPVTSNLINMYPLEIFIYLFFRIIITWLFFASILYVMVLIMRKMYNKERINNN